MGIVKMSSLLMIFRTKPADHPGMFDRGRANHHGALVPHTALTSLCLYLT